MQSNNDSGVLLTDKVIGIAKVVRWKKKTFMDLSYLSPKLTVNMVNLLGITCSIIWASSYDIGFTAAPLSWTYSPERDFVHDSERR
jgi:hypothetical protein